MLKTIERKIPGKSAFLSFFLLIFLFLLIFSTILLPNNVFGELTDDDDEEPEDEDDDGVDDDIENINERKVQIESEDDQVEIQSELKNGTIKDKIQLSFKTSDAPEINLEYKSETELIESELSLEVSFSSLIEFVDTDGNNVFDDSKDNKIQELELDVDYDPISYVIHDDGFGHEIHTFNTTSEDGIFSLQFYVVVGISQLHDKIVVPSEIKLDLAIRNFPFVESTSKIALYTKLEAETEFEIDYETEDEQQNRSIDEREVELTVGEYIGFFSWNEWAIIDGINRTVTNSNIERDSSDNEKIYLIYDHGNVILHDPKIGVEGVTKIELPFIPPEVLSNILSALTIPKEEYLLPVILLTIIMLPLALSLTRKNQV